MSEALKKNQSTGPRILSYVEAINEGVREVLLEQDNAFVAGEDVGRIGGPFSQYNNLYDEFGESRVIDTPISEKAIMGLGVGASAAGCRPIIDLMFIDFMGECMDEIANQMAKMRFMFGGGVTLPVTVLTMSGAGMSMAAQHSQSLEAWLAHLPGVKVVMPSNPYDAKGMIIAAARDNNPVFVILNKISLALKGEVPEGAYEVEMDKAQVVRSGSDFTIIAVSRMVHEATKAAEELSALGVEVEVIDARSIQPFDTECAVNSFKKTHKGLIVHEAVEFGGIGAEIAAQIQEQAFDYLDAPVGRVGAPFAPVPFSPPLEKIYVPDAQRIVAKAKSILGLD